MTTSVQSIKKANRPREVTTLDTKLKFFLLILKLENTWQIWKAKLKTAQNSKHSCSRESSVCQGKNQSPQLLR